MSTGQDVSDTSYTVWDSPTVPRSAEMDCVTMTNALFMWTPAPCSEQHTFICETGINLYIFICKNICKNRLMKRQHYEVQFSKIE